MSRRTEPRMGFVNGIIKKGKKMTQKKSKKPDVNKKGYGYDTSYTLKDRAYFVLVLCIAHFLGFGKKLLYKVGIVDSPTLEFE